MEDPDALSPKPFVHWLVANIPATTMELPAGLPLTDMRASAGNAVQGHILTTGDLVGTYER